MSDILFDREAFHRRLDVALDVILEMPEPEVPQTLGGLDLILRILESSRPGEPLSDHLFPAEIEALRHHLPELVANAYLLRQISEEGAGPSE